jgi:hypothetical protein
MEHKMAHVNSMFHEVHFLVRTDGVGKRLREGWTLEDQTTNTTQKRLRILGDEEIQALYGRPHFTDDERLEYFALSPTEKAVLEQLHSIKSRIYFILQLGYFKPHHMFFVFDLPEVEEDARYVQAQYFPDFQLSDLDITKVTRLRQQSLILELFRYRICAAEQREAIAAKARQAATVEKGRPLSQYPAWALPLRFIPETARRYLYTPGTGGHRQLLVDRYEFLGYRLLRNGLEAGNVFCRDSVRFRSFEDDLLDDETWKDNLIDNLGLPLLKQPIREHLAELEQQLENRLVEVNERIASGDNPHFKPLKRGSQVCWTLRYPQSSEPINHPFFDGLKQIDIGSLLHFVNRHCPFMEAFDHVLGRYAKQAMDDRNIIACLVAWGTNMGLGRMGDLSDIGYPTLSTTSDNFIRLETLREANDMVSNATAELPIFRHYDIGGVLHSSSDGQKFETGVNTINARYSPKYFGLKKGVVSYSLVANHVPMIAKIIGANDHESHYVFDILYNNTSDIQPEVHSTDTHGTNEVNFAILNVFGYQFLTRSTKLSMASSTRASPMRLGCSSLCGNSAPSWSLRNGTTSNGLWCHWR